MGVMYTLRYSAEQLEWTGTEMLAVQTQAGLGGFRRRSLPSASAH